MTSRIDHHRVAPDGAKALGAVHAYLGQSGLAPTLIDLVYLRVSLLNGCAYCIDLHSRDLVKRGMPVEKLVLVPVWHEAGALFDERERAALRWSESLTRIAETGAPQADYDAVAAVFTEKEIADLSIAIALMNAYNRLGVGLRKVPAAAARATA